ncbi:hypothetical protein [Rhizobium sp. Pop5]|nr:hypothetical protein [Rhizobium sp. Pop5]
MTAEMAAIKKRREAAEIIIMEQRFTESDVQPPEAAATKIFIFS